LSKYVQVGEAGGWRVPPDGMQKKKFCTMILERTLLEKANAKRKGRKLNPLREKGPQKGPEGRVGSTCQEKRVQGVRDLYQLRRGWREKSKLHLKKFRG